MDENFRHPAESGICVAAPSVDGMARIEQALIQAESHVARMDPSSGTQQIRQLLESFRRMVEGWRAVPPPATELRALEERVGRTLQLAKSKSPTLRFRRQA